MLKNYKQLTLHFGGLGVPNKKMKGYIQKKKRKYSCNRLIGVEVLIKIS